MFSPCQPQLRTRPLIGRSSHQLLSWQVRHVRIVALERQIDNIHRRQPVELPQPTVRPPLRMAAAFAAGPAMPHASTHLPFSWCGQPNDGVTVAFISAQAGPTHDTCTLPVTLIMGAAGSVSVASHGRGYCWSIRRFSSVIPPGRPYTAGSSPWIATGEFTQPGGYRHGE